MSVQELEAEVARLSQADMKAFARWFDEFRADAWDRQIEADANAGRLDKIMSKVDANFEAGQCKPL